MIRERHRNAVGFRALAAALLGMLLACAASAVESTAPPMPVAAGQPSGQALEELAEVWVHGKRLSNDIETAENDLFRRFNKKNKKGIYDIHCGTMSLHPGSMIVRRVCVPGYYELSLPTVIPAPMSTETVCMDSTGYGYGCGGSVMTSATVIPGIPLALLAKEHSEKFIDNLLNVINSDPQLLERALHLERLYREMLQVQLKYADIDVDEKTREKVVRKLKVPKARTRAVSTRVR